MDFSLIDWRKYQVPAPLVLPPGIPVIRQHKSARAMADELRLRMPKPAQRCGHCGQHCGQASCEVTGVGYGSLPMPRFILNGNECSEEEYERAFGRSA